MQIKFNHASFGFGDKELIHDFSFEINKGDKIAIIGKNGSGKTSLLKIILGEIELHQPDNMPPVFQILGSGIVGALSQMSFEDESVTLKEELLKAYSKITDMERSLEKLQKQLETDGSDKLVAAYSKLLAEYEREGGYSYHSELMSVLSSFGFSESDHSKKLSEFSGGQKTKIAFIKLILSKPDVLLLDEPTNHLDIKAVSWLENYLKAYKNSVVVVSHDREFLDNVVNFVYEIEYGQLTKYVGNYSKFVMTKQSNYESAVRAYEAQQREIADIKAFIERFRYKATKAAAVQSRVKSLEKMQILPPPRLPEGRSFRNNFKPNVQPGSEILSAVNLKIGYDKASPLATIDLKLMRGDRLAVLGGNGLGKSTLLETLAGAINPISGHFKFGYNTEIGYFKQIVSKFTSEKTLFETYQSEFPELDGREVRSSLGAFLFSGNDVGKPLSSLSGGEIVRFELCKLFEKRANVLLLDEPTNHMDILGKETLENLLLGYGGTIIFVSHDRYFINKIATKLLIFEGGEAKIFNGTYHEYISGESGSANKNSEKKNESKEEKPPKVDYPVDFDENAGDEFAAMPFYELSKEKNRLTNRLEKLENRSQTLKERLAQLESDFVDPDIASDFKKLVEIQSEMKTLKDESAELADDWLGVSSRLGQVEGELEKRMADTENK